MKVIVDASVTEVGVEAFLKFDGGGEPAYQDRGDINARVLREDRVTMQPDGSVLRTQYTIWVDSAQPYLPIWHDRLTFTTLGEGRTAIVEMHDENQDLAGNIDHVKLLCREE